MFAGRAARYFEDAAFACHIIGLIFNIAYQNKWTSGLLGPRDGRCLFQAGSLQFLDTVGE